MTLAAPTEHERTLALLRGPDPLAIAPRLLGAVLRVGSAEGVVGVRLTEVEAYAGEVDPGSHAYRGRTARTAPMFEAGGLLYVYFTYGMHWCANLVTGAGGTAAAVLLRAGEVIQGADLARERREAGRKAGSAARRLPERDLARGPANLARCLGLTGADSGAPLDPAGRAALVLAADPPGAASHGTSPGRVRTGPRVGVAGPGGDAEAHPWRSWLAGEPTVSAYRPGATRRPRRTEA